MRRLAARGLLLLLGLLLGLLAAELGFRTLSPRGYEPLLFKNNHLYPQDIFRPDAAGGHRPVPGAEALYRTPEFQTLVRFNSLGLRGEEPSPSARKLLTLGDSFTLGLQVDEDETWQALLAQSLSQSSGQEVEVLNGGVDGTCTWHAVQRLRDLGPQLELDGVLVSLYLGNDLLENQRRREGWIRPPLLHAGDLVYWSVPPWLAWSQIAAAVQTQVALRRLRHPQILKAYRQELSVFHPAHPRWTQLLGATRQALRELAQEAERQGLPLMLILVPSSLQVEEWRAESSFAMVGMDRAEVDLDLHQRVLPALPSELLRWDLTPDLRAAADSEALYHHFDAHWTPAGHQVVSQSLQEGWSQLSSDWLAPKDVAP